MMGLYIHTCMLFCMVWLWYLRLLLRLEHSWSHLKTLQIMIYTRFLLWSVQRIRNLVMKWHPYSTCMWQLPQGEVSWLTCVSGNLWSSIPFNVSSVPVSHSWTLLNAPGSSNYTQLYSTHSLVWLDFSGNAHHVSLVGECCVCEFAGSLWGRWRCFCARVRA